MESPIDQWESRCNQQISVLTEKGKTMSKCCDNCIYYHWYYNHCDKWNCEVDDRSVCSEFTERKDNDKINRRGCTF